MQQYAAERKEGEKKVGRRKEKKVERRKEKKVGRSKEMTLVRKVGRREGIMSVSQ